MVIKYIFILKIKIKIGHQNMAVILRPKIGFFFWFLYA